MTRFNHYLSFNSNNQHLDILNFFASKTEPISEFLDRQLSKVKEYVKQRIVFFQLYRAHPKIVGSATPSSALLAQRIIALIPEAQSLSHDLAGRCYLEVGPGSGVFTKLMAERLRPQDRLDAVEFLEPFAKDLREKFAKYPNVHVHCGAIQQWRPGYQYDAVVSGLPLNAFTPSDVQDCIDSLINLTKDDGTVSYFEYAFLPTLNQARLQGEQKDNFLEIRKIKKIFYETYGIGKELVSANAPPARVFHFRIHHPNETRSISTVPDAA